MDALSATTGASATFPPSVSGTDHVQVLIVGGGPVGMTLAASLHQNGVRVRIVDKDAGPTDGTRAPVFWPRSQEVLAGLGIRERWLAESIPLAEYSIHAYGKRMGNVRLEDVESPYPTALCNGQNVSETILRDYLAEVGCPVEFNTEAVEYRDQDSHAVVSLRRADGSTADVFAAWVVSAEGSKSVVRNRVGLDYAGEKYVGFRIHVADVHVRWNLPTRPGQGYFFVEKGGYLGGQTLPGDPHRFYFYILTPDERPEEEKPTATFDEIQELVRRFSGDPAAELSNLRWLSVARYRHGYADAFRRGRALLAGDTAHIVVPLYGQGMNYGIQDAWNLGWKLAHVVHGWAPADLLDTYDSERRKLAPELDEQVNDAFQSITKPKPLQSVLARTLGTELLSFDTLRDGFRKRFTELNLNYRKTGLSEQTHAFGRIEAGDRMPSLYVVRLPEQDTINLLDLFKGRRWTLLLIANPTKDDDEFAYFRDIADEVRQHYLAQVCSYLVQPGACAPTPTGWGGAVLMDAEGDMATQLHLSAGAIYLVRPDGYVGFCAKPKEGKSLYAYLDRWLCAGAKV